MLKKKFGYLFFFVPICKTASSTFQVPVWSLGMQVETKGSWDFIKSKCPLIVEAFSADDKLLIGNGQGDTEE